MDRHRLISRYRFTSDWTKSTSERDLRNRRRQHEDRRVEAVVGGAEGFVHAPGILAQDRVVHHVLGQRSTTVSPDAASPDDADGHRFLMRSPRNSGTKPGAEPPGRQVRTGRQWGNMAMRVCLGGGGGAHHRARVQDDSDHLRLAQLGPLGQRQLQQLRNDRDPPGEAHVLRGAGRRLHHNLPLLARRRLDRRVVAGGEGRVAALERAVLGLHRGLDVAVWRAGACRADRVRRGGRGYLVRVGQSAGGTKREGVGWGEARGGAGGGRRHGESRGAGNEHRAAGGRRSIRGTPQLSGGTPRVSGERRNFDPQVRAGWTRLLAAALGDRGGSLIRVNQGHLSTPP